MSELHPEQVVTLEQIKTALERTQALLVELTEAASEVVAAHRAWEPGWNKTELRLERAVRRLADLAQPLSETGKEEELTHCSECGRKLWPNPNPIHWDGHARDCSRIRFRPDSAPPAGEEKKEEEG